MMSGTEETTMSQKSKEAGLDRRNFFKALGAGATAAVAPVAATPAAAVDPGKDETKSRYRETDHVKAYYRTNRY